MRAKWVRCQKWCAAVASGGLTLGILQGFALVDFASLFTRLLTAWLSALVTLLFGGEVAA